MKCKALSIVAAVALVATTLIPFANASAWTATSTETPTYRIVREINNVTDNVTNTFTYSITPEASNPTTVSGMPTSATIEFDEVVPVNGKASQFGIIDLSSAVFTELGDYGFKIKEVSTSDASKYPLSSDTYIAWISVRNVTSGGVLTGDHTATLVGVTDSSDNKVETGASDGKVTFSDGNEHTYIEVKVTAKGNSADPNECFKINVHFANDNEEGYHVKTDTTCKNNLALLTANGISGSNITTIYLKNGDSATIGIDEDDMYQIPLDLQYVVIEEAAADYKTFIDGSSTDSKVSATKTTVGTGNPEFNNQNVTDIVNIKEITPRTGLIRSLLPYAVIAVIGVTGAILVIKHKSK